MVLAEHTKPLVSLLEDVAFTSVQMHKVAYILMLKCCIFKIP